MNIDELQQRCASFVSGVIPADVGHDIGHVRRVVANVRALTDSEGADPYITVPAAWLHDCVAVAKNSPLRNQGSRLAAEEAGRFLRQLDYPEQHIPAVQHAIEAHSWSAGIAPATLEAQVVQDGDRLDSLGAIGIARCLLVGGRMDRPLCHLDDPFCEQREPDDASYTLDHFYEKLFKLPEFMQTEAGRAEGRRRVRVMQAWLEQLRLELNPTR